MSDLHKTLRFMRKSIEESFIFKLLSAIHEIEWNKQKLTIAVFHVPLFLSLGELCFCW